MATLRNKTTEAGIIVRWKPHPDHNRPSTYQVTDRAVSFLEGIGFQVPSAGDETEIPWDVCRPLRVLGDLHFKSEKSGEVETGNLAEVNDDFGRSLTDDQQERLRNYIERHPNYGATSQSLEGELSSLPEKVTTAQVETTTNGIKESNGGRGIDFDIRTDDIIVGRVDRISSSGNAMLKTDSGTEYNLGPLTEDIAGEVVPVAVGTGMWALCLISEFWNREYLEYFAHKQGYEYSSVAQHYLNSEETDRRGRSLAAHNVEIGDIINVEITTSGSGITLGEYRDTIVEVDAYVPMPIGTITVEVVDNTNPILTTAPTISESDAPESGETIDVVVDTVDDQNGYCLHDGILVSIPGGSVSTGTSLRAAITTVKKDLVTATVAALPEKKRPQQGETVWIEDGALLEYDMIPVELPPELEGTSDRLRLEVTTVAEDHVEVTGRSWRLLPDASVGDKLDSAIINWFNDGTLATVDGVPVLLNGFHSNYGSHRQIELTGLGDEYIQAEVVEPIHRIAEGLMGEYLESMEHGHWRLDENDCGGAADSFSSGMGLPPDEHPVCWIDARACFAYATCWSLARDERFSGSHNTVAEAREDLQSMRGDSPEAVDLCLEELEILEHAVYAVEAWSQRNQSNVSPRKVRATAKREVRVAVEKSEAFADAIDEIGLNRQTIHPLVVLAIEDTATKLDVVHDSVSEFLDKYVSVIEPIRWTSLASIEGGERENDREFTDEEHKLENEKYTLVEPFDASRKASDELSTLRSRADEAAIPDEDAIVFRNSNPEYQRSEPIQKYVRSRANGACEACGKDLPFKDTHGRPYLEFHHVDEFEMAGPDVPSRVVALCPTCHTRIHAGEDGPKLNDELRQKLDDGLDSLGVE